MLRTVIAPNPSPMTLDGTRTYIVGREQVAIIDPGPAIPEHMDAIAAAVGDGVAAAILLTHAHPDHDQAVRPLCQRLNARVYSDEERVRDGNLIPTDAGDLEALFTPGHTADHYSFWWPAERSVFCGDLMMGGLNTALVAVPEGDLGQYLGSLERLRSLSPTTIYPAHGEPFPEPEAAIDNYIAHRHEREQQVMAGLEEGSATADQLTTKVYGPGLAVELRDYATAAVCAYLEHLRSQGLVRSLGTKWEKT